MKKISVIVPAYNAEPYLKRCVDSLLNQTIDETEIILVDDGSTDKTPEICDYYAGTYERVTVIHKSNGGLSSARNAGIDKASGRFIGFVDADDDVEPDMYMRLYTKAIESEADYVFCDYARICQSGEKQGCTRNIDEGFYPKAKIRQVLFPQLIMGETIDYGPCLSVWTGLYRKQFLDEYHIRFDPAIKWSEDNLFTSMVVYSCNSLFYLKGEYLYHYRENAGSITTSYRKGAWDVYCLLNQRFHAFFDNTGDYDFSREINLNMIYYALNCLQQEKKYFSPESGKVIHRMLHSDELKKAFSGFKMPGVSWKLKIILQLMRVRAERFLWLYCKTH